MHKDIVGTRCFQRITVDVEFDHRLQITEHRITGGRWLTAEEYQRWVRMKEIEAAQQKREDERP